MKGWRNPVSLGILTALLFGLAACVRPTPPVSGTRDGEIHWRGRVYVDGDVIFAEGSRLVIAPGTEVIFLPPGAGRDRLTEHPNFPGGELIVKGELVAEGTAKAPIVFRHIDPQAPPGGWGGVNLTRSPRASFRFCRFTQADSAVHGQEATVSIEESLFENNLVGIRFFSSRMRIENNLLRRNGTAIRFHFGAPAIFRNELVDNQRALFLTSFPRDYRIEANNITGSREYSVVLGEEVPDDVLLPNNYWGSTDVAAIEATFFDGRRVDYLGSARIEPILDRPVAGVGISWNP